MSDKPQPQASQTPVSEADLQDMVSAADTGARQPKGWQGQVLALIALCWSVFQLLLASPFSAQILPGDAINNARQIHLAFAMVLASMAYPLWRFSARDRIPLTDWVLALAGCGAALYGFIFFHKIANNGGLADPTDARFALAGLVLLFVAAYRTLGPVMVVLALVFLGYVFFGDAQIVPDQIRWAGASLRKAMSHMWTTSEGVFGIALGVSTKFVFLFVLFGALLDRAGAGNYFTKLAFGALGGLRGGPAKAAVVGSAATGIISGSSIANVVTTGTFTIPLMKRVGFSAEKSGAVEVASSVNGQIMPPVMGAAAFLMVEYIGISYVQVITHAFLPAVISYIALVYIVHLEAVKQNLSVIGDGAVNLGRTIMGTFGFFAGFAGLCWALQFPVRLVANLVPGSGIAGLALLIVLAYVALVRLAAGSEDLELDDPQSDQVALPKVSQIYKTGLYHLLPIAVLIYFLMIERKSPGLSAFYAAAFLICILLTQKPLKAWFRGEDRPLSRLRDGVADVAFGMIDGARNMIGIALATATAGIIVGTVSLTGIGQVMAAFVEFLSAGNLVLMLVFVALLSVVLGMGLPTTANYIVVSSLMVGVLVELAGQSGILIPLVAAHLFVFYFGIMADVTSPVGLASFAAAAISGGDVIRTGFTAFFYSLRTVALPFVFVFNTDLLLIDVGWVKGIAVFVVATVGILIFTSATMGWLILRNRIWETVALLLVALALFRPGLFLDQVQPPFQKIETSALSEAIVAAEPGQVLRFNIEGPDFDTGAPRDMSLAIQVPQVSGGDARLADMGFMGIDAGVMEEPAFGSEMGKALSGLDFYGDTPVRLLSVEVEVKQAPKELVFIPAMALFAVVALAQLRRRKRNREGDVQ